MREIKFRFWDKDDRRMIAGIPVYGEFTRYKDSKHRRFWDTAAAFRYPDEFIPMQYTGLKDKNGVEIYEGDLLKKEGRKKEVTIFEVVFHEAGFTAKNTDSPSAVPASPAYARAFERLEVIGNIHETRNY
ncbi:MAG: hypothetical protein GY755_03920 [Chloroflexi bacterium]|nr:hypothetical protein [Chloroflexota bacterium]